jgi:NAD(P)H-hydrate epimerase
MLVATTAEMRALDRFAIEHGTPGHVLMERAGTGAVRVLRRHWPRLRGPVVIVCGRGNNGGDGFVMARRMKAAGVRVSVWLVGDRDAVTGDAAHMLRRWRGKTHEVGDDLGPLRAALAEARLVVDALLGTGLNAPVTGLAAEVVDAINAAPAPVLAVDVPSGLSADTGQPLGVAVVADVTATFGLPKVGQCLHPGVDLCGRLEVVDIGIPTDAVAAIAPRIELLEAAGVGALLPPRTPEAHKGTNGHVLIVAGSRGKLGAALLAADASVRSGAGLTTLAVPDAVQPLAEARVPEVMTAGLPDGAEGGAALGDGRALAALLEGRSVVVCGPGLGLTDETRSLVSHLVRTATVPLVLDADALTALAGTRDLEAARAPVIVTPHPGEMSRLLGRPTKDVQEDRIGSARQLAATTGVICVLKGARTVVAAPDGRVVVSPTGNPGMGSGGMGDALSGILGALLAQGLRPADAAALGVYAHGAAADAVAARRGQVGLRARDVIEEMPPTLAALQAAGQAAGGHA